MDTVETPVTLELMRAISASFNSRDVERILAHFADDATFYLARGPEPVGRTLAGKAAIRQALTDRFKQIPDMRWEHKEYVLMGDRAVSVWSGSITTMNFSLLNADAIFARFGKLISGLKP